MTPESDLALLEDADLTDAEISLFPQDHECNIIEEDSRFEDNADANHLRSNIWRSEPRSKTPMKGKPTRFGYKVWSMAPRDGYLISFEPYQGAASTPLPDQDEFGPVIVVVTELSQGYLLVKGLITCTLTAPSLGSSYVPYDQIELWCNWGDSGQPHGKA